MDVMGATGKGIQVRSGILAEGVHWRVRRWTKMASAERGARDRYLLNMSVSCSLNYACEMCAFFVTKCSRRQDCPIWSPNKDLRHILPVHLF